MGKASNKAREFKAENRRESYKFWLGFLEKLFLPLFATIAIPFSIERSEVFLAIRVFWLSLCACLLIIIFALSSKLSKLSLKSEGGDL